MTIFNYILDNNVIFYSIFAGTAGILGYSLCKSILNHYESNSDFDYLNTDLETTSNIYSEVNTQTVPGSVSSQTTVLPVSSQNVEILSNKDITEYTLSNKSLVDSKINEINELFSKEMFDSAVTEADLTYIVKQFSITELNSSNINEIILSVLENFNG
jgi:hypothetical protein